MEFPAAFPHVLAAAALGAGDTPASFSSKGPDVDLAAPGTDVLTAVPPLFDPDGTPDGWALLSGTSFASPMIAAAATALRAVRPGLDSGQLATLLCRSARDVAPAGWDRRTGCGFPNLAAAVRAAAPAPDPAEPNDDIVWVDGIGLGEPSPPIWQGVAPRELRASVTAQHDRVDVYPVLLPPRSRVKVVLVPLTGGADLRLLDRSALDISDRDALLAASRHRGRAADRAVVANRTRRARVAYVTVVHDPRSGVREVRYRLRLRRG